MRNNRKEQNWLTVRRAKRVQQMTLDGYVKVRPAKEQSSTLTNFLLTKEAHEHEVKEITVLPESAPIPASQSTTLLSADPTNISSIPIITLMPSQPYKEPLSVRELPSAETQHFEPVSKISGVVSTSVPSTESPLPSASSIPSIDEKSSQEKDPALSSPAPQCTKDNLSLNDSLFNDSYDFPVNLKNDRKFAYKADPTRKKDERKKLCGHACHCCKAYFEALDLSSEEKEQRINAVSRHRDVQAPPSTPDHFWEVGFPSTAEIMERKKQYYGDLTTKINPPLGNPRNKLYSRRKLS